LRHRRDRELGSTASRTARGTPPAGEAGAHARHPDLDHAARYAEARADLARWLREGKLAYREDILEGIEHAPGAIAGLYRGDNLGKRLIRIA
jgi:hypothetical protein